jgi:hypothetical protein
MAPLALANYAAYEVLKKRGDGAAEEPAGELPPGKKKRCAVVLDIGTDGSNLIITDGAKIIWQRPVPLGGNNFTRVLTKEMKLTFAKAEHLKRNAAKSPDLAQILKALRPVLTDFVGEVQRSLGYFTNTHRDAHVAYMVGLGSAFKLPGLQKYLSEKLSLEVRKPAKFDGVAGDAVLNDPAFSDNLLTFPVAYGLALQALALTHPNPDDQKKYALLRTNLLPQEIRTDRLIRAKKPWAAAAAACLLLGAGGVALGHGVQYRSVTDKVVADAMKKAEGSVKATKDQNGTYTKTEGEAKDEANKVKAIVAGNEERLNWVRLHEVVAAALPRPPFENDPGNFDIPEPKRSEYLNAKEHNTVLNVDIDAPAAIKQYYGRVRQGVPPEKLYDATRSADLPVVNIETIDCRWTDNLQGFLDAANKLAFDTDVLNIVEDLKDERTVQANVVKEDGTTEVVDVKLPAEREPSDTPNVKATKPEHKFNPKAPEGGAWVVELRGYTYHQHSWVFVRDTLVYNLQHMNKVAAARDPNKVKKLLPNVEDPTLGKISHVFLGAYDTTKSEQVTKNNPVKLNLITRGLLDRLLGPSGAPGGMPGGMPGGPGEGGMGEGGRAAMGAPSDTGSADGMGGPGMMMGGGGSGWRGLLRGGAGGGSDMGGMGGPGGGRGMPGGLAQMFGGMFGGAEGMDGMDGMMGGPAVGPAQTGGGKKNQQLCEFIVYFIWREPTPTDALTAETPSN